MSLNRLQFTEDLIINKFENLIIFNFMKYWNFEKLHKNTKLQKNTKFNIKYLLNF